MPFLLYTLWPRLIHFACNFISFSFFVRHFFVLFFNEVSAKFYAGLAIIEHGGWSFAIGGKDFPHSAFPFMHFIFNSALLEIYANNLGEVFKTSCTSFFVLKAYCQLLKNILRLILRTKNTSLKIRCLSSLISNLNFNPLH